MVRYADDYVLGFKYEREAHGFADRLAERLNKFGLSLHEEKTKLIRFGRFAKRQCFELGLGKPKTFDFLGFTHICAETFVRQKFVVKRHTNKKRYRKTLQAIKHELLRRRHAPIPVVGKWLNRVVQGYYNYHAVPGNLVVLNNFQREVTRYWLKALRRRSQRSRMNWERFTKLRNMYIPSPKVMHPYPFLRFDAKYSR